MNSTWGRPSASGRPPVRESRPKETSLGRGLGRVEVSILEGGEERGEDEGSSPPSGREDDMSCAVGRRRGLPSWLTAGVGENVIGRADGGV